MFCIKLFQMGKSLHLPHLARLRPDETGSVIREVVQSISRPRSPMGQREVWRGCAREHAHEPVRVEIGLRRASVTKNVIEGAERRDLLVGMAKVCGACQNTSNFLVWRECFRVAAATSCGRTKLDLDSVEPFDHYHGPSQLGQSQMSREEGKQRSDSVDGCGG